MTTEDPNKPLTSDDIQILCKTNWVLTIMLHFSQPTTGYHSTLQQGSGDILGEDSTAVPEAEAFEPQPIILLHRTL